MQEALRLILSVEASAKDVVADTEAAVYDLESVADEEIAKVKEIALSLAEKRAEDIRVAAREEIEKREREIRAATQREIDLLTQKAEEHIAEAAQLAVDAVLGSSS